MVRASTERLQHRTLAYTMEAQKMAMGRESHGRRQRQVDKTCNTVAAMVAHHPPSGQEADYTKRRWEQDFIDFLSSRGVMEVGQTWRELACNAEAWRSFEDEFAKQSEHR